MFVLAEALLCPYCVPVCLISPFDFLQVGGVLIGTLLTLPDVFCVQEGVTHTLVRLTKVLQLVGGSFTTGPIYPLYTSILGAYSPH